MTNWQISESAISVMLRDDGRGDLAFTVTNRGPAQDRAVLTVTPLDGAAESWFTVDEPQRAVGPGMSVVYKVEVAAPPGTAAGTYAAVGVVYSADSDPGESSATSKRIEVVVATARPKPSSPRWPYWVAAAAVVLVLVVIGAVVLTRGGAEAESDLPDLQARIDPACGLFGGIAGDFFLELDVGVLAEGPVGSLQQVPVVVQGETTGAEGRADVPIGDGTPTTTVIVFVRSADTATQQRYSVTVDPDDEVAESDEADNVTTIVAEFGTFPLRCTTV